MPAPRWAASAEAHPRWVCPLACCELAAPARPLQQPALIHPCEALLRGHIASLSAGVFGHSSMTLGTPGVAGLGGGLFAGYANLAAAGAPGGQGGPMQGGQDGLPANALNTLRMMLQASTMAQHRFLGPIRAPLLMPFAANHAELGGTGTCWCGGGRFLHENGSGECGTSLEVRKLASEDFELIQLSSCNAS